MPKDKRDKIAVDVTDLRERVEKLRATDRRLGLISLTALLGLLIEMGLEQEEKRLGLNSVREVIEPNPYRCESIKELVMLFWDKLANSERFEPGRLDELMDGEQASPAEVVKLSFLTGLTEGEVNTLNGTSNTNGKPATSS